MTILYAKVFCLHALICIVSAELTNQLESETLDTCNSNLKVDFAESLKNENNNILDYATERRALFCSVQPICITEVDRNSTDALNPLRVPETKVEDVNKISGPCTSNSKVYKDEGCYMPMIFLCAARKDQAMDYRNASEVLGHLHGTPGSDEENSMAACSDIPKAYDHNVHGLPTRPYVERYPRNLKSTGRGSTLSTLRVNGTFGPLPYYRSTITSAVEVRADEDMTSAVEIRADEDMTSAVEVGADENMTSTAEVGADESKKKCQENIEAYTALVLLYICMVLSVTRCALIKLYMILSEINESAYQCNKTDQIGG